jgi:hypothetical protein
VSESESTISGAFLFAQTSKIPYSMRISGDAIFLSIYFDFMSPFNPNTGEFDGETNKNPEADNIKNMITQDGRKVLLLENGDMFDPSMGVFISGIDPKTLKEDNN